MTNKSILTVLMTAVLISIVPAQAGWEETKDKFLETNSGPA